jgi:membrane protein
MSKLKMAHTSLPKPEVSATAPRDITKAGWWSILKRVYKALDQKNISVLSGGVAFYGILSIFPGLAALIAVYGLLANPAIVQYQFGSLGGVIPGEARNLIAKFLSSIVNSSSSRLGTGLIVSILIALWSARAAIVSLIEALNVAYEEEEKRGPISFQILALGLTVAAILFVIAMLLLIAVLPAVVQFLPLGEELKTVALAARWPILIVIVAVGVTAFYRFAPSRREAQWRWLTMGSTTATALWLLASLGFSFYVERFGSYDKTFGSLGAGMVLMTWLYISAYVVLLGGCLDAEMERQTTHDPAEGAASSLPHRRARSADTPEGDARAPGA